MNRWFGKVIILGLALTVGFVQAQSDACPALVEQALEKVGQACTDLERNTACYGHGSLEVELVDDAEFDTEGDVVELQDIQRLTLSSLDVEESVWGISLIALQANLPDTLPGQNATFVLFGDVSVENATTASEEGDAFAAPLQAFYFTSGIGDAACTEAPQSGLMIQTPEGSGEVTFQANEVTVTLGSTAFFQAEPGGEMIVYVIEGQATLTSMGVTVTVPAGAQAKIALDENGSAADAPGEPQAYNLDNLMALPLVLLEREITIAEPIEMGASTSTTTTTEDSGEDQDTEESTSEPVGGAFNVTANGGEPLGDCSTGGEELYTFTVENQSSRSVTLYWIDYYCNRVDYGTIEPGASKDQGTYPTHPWILTDAETGQMIFGPWGASSPSGFTITVTD